jgi:protein-S-isoprenylcysteine O-methyltransferase Ste14
MVMYALDPRIAGIVILASSVIFLVVKRWTTGSFLKGRPERGPFLWFTHVYNLFFLLAVSPAVAILLVARRWETLDPTIVDPGQGPWHLGFEIGGLLLCLAGNSLMCWALVTMQGHFQVLGKTPRSTDRLLLSGPYALVRHPMYTSVLCLSMGLAFLTQSLAIFALFCVYAGIIPSLVAFEEEGLRRAYGEQFAAYQSRVKKLIPLFY